MSFIAKLQLDGSSVVGRDPSNFDALRKLITVNINQKALESAQQKKVDRRSTISLSSEGSIFCQEHNHG